MTRLEKQVKMISSLNPYILTYQLEMIKSSKEIFNKFKIKLTLQIDKIIMI